MLKAINDIFTDADTIKEIQHKLPKLFRIAEIESSRAGKIGMEVGFLRERIIVGLLIYKFGVDNVDTKIPSIEPETDVRVFGKDLSIKTITNDGGVKAVWTVDAKSSDHFIRNYKPKCDILLVQIWWGKKKGGFFLIPCLVQKQVFDNLGYEKYLKMPKAGTNPRGIEFTRDALDKMLHHNMTMKISIDWIKRDVKYEVLKRWIEMWEEI